MGSGSFGGGGGGGGGGSWSSRGGGYSFQGGRSVETAASAEIINKGIQEVFKTSSIREYIEKQFESPFLISIYEELFLLSVHLFQNHSWEGITETYGINDDQGCLMRWVNSICELREESEPNQKFRETARECLEDFLIEALDSDAETYFYGNSQQVMAQLDPNYFNRASNHFLGLLLWRIVERHSEKSTIEDETRLKDATQRIANNIISSFEKKFYAKNQTTYRHLLQVISANKDWFIKQLRQ